MAGTPHRLIPHLVVGGVTQAIDLYKKALGATEVMRIPAQDGKRVMHAELAVGGSAFYLRDDFPEHRGTHGDSKVMDPKSLGGTSIVLHLEVENCDSAVKQAADAGAKVTMPPFDAFWGARYGEVIDPFGQCWSFSHPMPAKAA
jgi:PhnB protein